MNVFVGPVIMKRQKGRGEGVEGFSGCVTKKLI